MGKDRPSNRTELSDSALYRSTFDPDSEPATDAVLRTLSEFLGAEPGTFESIDTVVDPIVLDALVRRHRRDILVSFVYAGYVVSVESNGGITVRSAKPDTDEEPTDTESDSVPAVGVTDKTAFEDALCVLLREAERQGVDVEGGWECRDSSDRPQYGIEIYEVV